MNASRIVGLFLAFGVAWILISDRILEFLIQNPHARQTAQSVKGVVFVLASTVLIYVLVRQAERERSRLEAETLREKDRLARVLEVAPAVIYSLQADPAGPGFVTDFVSDQIEPMMGYRVDQWLAQPDFWRQHIHPDDLARVDQAQQTLFESGRVHHEYRFQHADGRYRWVNDTLILHRDAAGQPVQIHGAWLDISERKRVELAMIEADRRYRNLFRLNPQPMWIYDEQSLRFISVNEAALNKYGYTREEFLAMTVLDVRPPEDVARFKAMLTDHEASGRSQLLGGAWRHRKKDGSLFWVEIAGHSLEFDGLKARLILITDITDRYQAEERLRLISHVFDASQEGISITDANNRYVSVNRAFTRITGYAPEDVIGKTPVVQKSGRHDKAFYEQMWQQLREEGHWEGEVWNRRKSGEIYPQWLIITVIKDAQGQVQQYMGIFMDSTGRKAAEERIQRLANYDILTGLPNRTLLFDRAKVAFAAAGRTHAPVVVMHLNVDHFQHVNESLGHEVGDEVLVTLSQRLLTALRPEDTVSRLGGDDFIILLPHITARDVATVAMRLMTAVAEPLTVGGQELRLTASVGIAEFPENGADLVQLTQAAESAVSQAKREGRNTFRFFSRGVQDQVKETLVMERDLRLAVERRQLVLHYQPQIDVANGRLVGLEALVRWQHPEWGLVPPGRFIPVAEASGMIREIGRWVLDTALQQNAAWAAAGLAIVPVAVNLSMAQFKDPGLRDAVIEALQLSGLPPAMVELELTESVAMEDSNFTIATIDGLKRLGVALSIDDFGTGYSSLSYLKRFDIDKLKIDQSFVRGLKFDPQDEVIVVTVINLAHSLGLRTIAEGVETQDQLDFLRAHGCDQYQGYLCSRPVPAEDVVQWLSPVDTPGAASASQ